MGFIPPSSISTSSPGQSAAQNSQSSQLPKSSGLYDINYAYQQQTRKNDDATLRFSLSVPNGSTTLKFQGTIDPNHLIKSAEKRGVALDVLTGVVVQDFGFNAETLELKGTTGSGYYRQIDILHSVYKSQSSGGNPSKVTVVIEGKTYTAWWREFVYDRQNTAAGGNTINYTMSFIILPKQYSTSISFSRITPSNVLPYTTGAQAIQAATTGGKSVWQYAKSQSSLAPSNLKDYCTFIENNYSVSDNNGLAFPGINIPLKPTQTINIPSNLVGYMG